MDTYRYFVHCVTDDGDGNTNETITPLFYLGPARRLVRKLEQLSVVVTAYWLNVEGEKKYGTYFTSQKKG